MADDGKIYITISDVRGGGSEPTPTPVTPTDPEEDKEKKNKNIYAHAFYDFMKEQVNKIVNYSIGNIGNFTGNYEAQKDVNIAKGIISKVSGIAIAGATLGIVGVGIAVAGTAVSYGLEEISNQFENKKKNYNITMLRQMSGLDELTNGSR